ncbi:MAG: TetR/AcrR family transcriptional regulator [Planctomycetota bacterium]|nr:TetR/AcrR family transcriptional regulator [Planctomycetota bacterium]
MGRDSDPAIKDSLLEQVLSYLLKHGLQNLSLRPMASEIGSNARMLVYHFGSKDQLIVDALGLAQRRVISKLEGLELGTGLLKDDLPRLWEIFCSEDMTPVVRLFIEVDVLALSGADVYLDFSNQMVELWVGFVERQLGLSSRVVAHLIVNTLTGLLLDRLVTADKTRIDESFAVFVGLLAGGLERAE